MKKLTIIFILLFGVTTSILFFNLNTSNIQNTIANFPIDETKQFSKATTTLQLIEQKDNDEYTIEWKTSSEIPEKMLLSHDISLLFEDGRLKEIMNSIKDNSNKLQQKVKVTGEDSGHFETITFHYGQISYPNEEKKSVQSMSYDQLYILDTPLSPIEFFKVPQTPSELEGKRILDTIIQQNLQYTWQELIDYFQIPDSNYLPVPLTNLYKYNSESLPKLTQVETQEILSLTWEAIYKYYFLGIEKQDGTLASPIESSVPLVLFHKTYSHFLIIFSGENGGKYNIIKNTDRF